MRTEQQLRTVLRSVADRAPDTDGVLQRLQLPEPHPSRPVSRRVLIAVAAGVAVILAGAVVLPRLDQREPQPSAAGGGVYGNWSMASQITPPPGWTLVSRTIADTYEATGIGDGTGKGFCTVEVNKVGSAPHTPQTGDTIPVTINSRPGTYTDDYTGGNTANSEPAAPGVFWQYADNAWASIVCGPGPAGLGSAATAGEIQTLILDLGEGVTIGTYPLFVPIRFDQLPDGYTVQSATQPAQDPRQWEIRLLPTHSGPDQPGPDQPAITITLATSSDDGPAPNTQVGTYSAIVRTDYFRGPMTATPSPEISQTSLDLPTTGVPVRLATLNTATDDIRSRQQTLEQVATHLRYAASPTDTATWFNAEDALL